MRFWRNVKGFIFFSCLHYIKIWKAVFSDGFKCHTEWRNAALFKVLLFRCYWDEIKTKRRNVRLWKEDTFRGMKAVSVGNWRLTHMNTGTWEHTQRNRQSCSGGEMVVLLRTHLPISLTASMVPIGSLYPRLPKNTTHAFTRDLKGKCVFDA